MGGLVKFNSGLPFREYQQRGLCPPDNSAGFGKLKKTWLLLWGNLVPGGAGWLLFTTWENTGSVGGPSEAHGYSSGVRDVLTLRGLDLHCGPLSLNRGF